MRSSTTPWGEVRHREGIALHPLGRRRRARHHRGPLHPRSAYRRAEAVGTTRRPGCLHQPRGHPHLQRLLVCEIPAGGALAPQRQLFEEMILVLEGQGSTKVWNDSGAEVTFEWQAGSIFAIPLNALTSTSTAPAARRRASSPRRTCLPSSTSTATRTSSSTPRGTSRTASTASPTTSPPGRAEGPAARHELRRGRGQPSADRGEGAGRGWWAHPFAMAKGSMNSHISQFPTATYKKGHRHGPGAHVIILSGEGYSLMWPRARSPAATSGAGSVDRPAEHVVPPALQHRC